jgi:hypothetical protein
MRYNAIYVWDDGCTCSRSVEYSMLSVECYTMFFDVECREAQIYQPTFDTIQVFFLVCFFFGGEVNLCSSAIYRSAIYQVSPTHHHHVSQSKKGDEVC